ncbi:hypothetical protein PIB30_055407 [Stylosanthes scabra]|uniref:Uncharacterized protein n=1 Tax=Stylosanthes scabra TaxID=79078 RepID=A0ABU6WMF4_9FABA|nr:hypothetical protein [Stylosanthes scabra]
MAENLQGDQPAEGAVQIPRELPFIDRWVEAARRGERVCFLNVDHPTVPHWLWMNELHPNPWSSIHCFELVTEFSELPQDPEVFLYLFKLYCSNTSGKTKKGYMSVRPGKNRKIFALYEDSFHDFKGCYFKIFPVWDHRPFWLSLEGDGRFPSYWSDQAGFEIVPATYQRLNADQRDTADILVHLFSKNNLNPKFIMNSSDEARKAIMEMAGNDVTLSRLQNLLHLPPTRVNPSLSGHQSGGRARSPPAVTTSRVVLKGGSSSGVGKEDLVESVRWAEWAMLRSATILKSIEPRLTVADEVERRNEKLVGDMKVLNLQKVILEEQKAEAVAGQLKAEEDLKSAKAA